MQANNHTHKQTRRVKSSGVDTIAFQKCACAISISINTPNSHTQILCTHWIWLAGWSAATKKLDGDKLLIQIKLDLTYDVRYFSHTHVLCKMQLHKMTCNFSHKFCVNFLKFKKILTVLKILNKSFIYLWGLREYLASSERWTVVWHQN